MLIVSPDFKCSNEILTIVSMLSGTGFGLVWQISYLYPTVPNIWLRPNNQRKEADHAKALLTIPESDHLTLLNVYNSWVQSMCWNFLTEFLYKPVLFQTWRIQAGHGPTMYPNVHFCKPRMSDDSWNQQ